MITTQTYSLSLSLLNVATSADKKGQIELQQSFVTSIRWNDQKAVKRKRTQRAMPSVFRIMSYYSILLIIKTRLIQIFSNDKNSIPPKNKLEKNA